MSETAIVLLCATATSSIVYRGPPCAACRGDRDPHTPFQSVGFCRECLDRSRIVAGDDIGGEG